MWGKSLERGLPDDQNHRVISLTRVASDFRQGSLCPHVCGVDCPGLSLADLSVVLMIDPVGGCQVVRPRRAGGASAARRPPLGQRQRRCVW